MAAFVALPFYFRYRFGYSAVEIGLLITPWPIALACIAPIAGRLADRYPAGLLGGIGLVVFANYPDLACPPTLDHGFLIESAEAVRSARPGDDGTNIGDALAWSLDALRHTTPAKKVLILLTDGNNQPAVPRPLDPVRAAELARDLGVTLHTIAIGRKGGVVHGTDERTDRPVVAETQGPNLPLLQSLADVTWGRSFVATDADALREVFETINRLEKSQIQNEIRTRYDERFLPWAVAAVGLLSLDRLLTSGRLRRLP